MRLIEIYRSIMQGVWNIGFVENTLDGVIAGEPLKIKWLNHECTPILKAVFSPC